MSKKVSVNGRDYNWPKRPVVVICCDGSEPEYTEVAMQQGLMDNLKRVIERGENLRCDCVIPSFTNPNNLSIVTGRPPAIHGISGNYFIDPTSGEEVMVNDPKFLRVPTIFEAFQSKGARVVVITAKDKLRRLLGKGLNFGGENSAIAFSSEKSDQCTLAENGIENVNKLVGMDVPDVYSAELSEFIFKAGVILMKEHRPDLMYLSTTDYVQHKHAPGSAGANAFYKMLDQYIGELDALDTTIVMTADHGMKPKHTADGKPNILYLQDLMDEYLGSGEARVILPITDPYVVHHGALGSFATVYLNDKSRANEILARLNEREDIEVALNNHDGCARFELPQECLGDIIVVSVHSKVLGKTEADHDLSGLDAPLRSHGGVSEQRIPFIINRPIDKTSDNLRNFDAFDYALNHVN